jgi:hypothetical protein
VPSPEHEALVRLFRDRPEMAARLLARVARGKVPPFHEARVARADMPDDRVAEYHADLVVEHYDARGAPRMGVVVEVQLGRDPDKPFTWPYYCAALRARLRCPAHLLVVAPDPRVARWAARPVPMGHRGWTFTPLVLGPSAIPVVTDARAASQEPELAVLSAIAHAGEGGDPALGERVARAALQAALRLDDDRAEAYIRMVLRAASERIRNRLEETMRPGQLAEPTELEKRLEARGEARGEVRGRAVSVLAVLGARGVEVSPAVRERIMICEDVAQLERWLARAVHATDVQDLFEPA